MPTPYSKSRSATTADRDVAQELAWFHALSTGDAMAFESLFRAYAGPLYAFAYSYISSSSTAEEIVQDLFTHLWERREMLEAPRNVSAYLYRATRNRAVSYLRNQRVQDAFQVRALRAAHFKDPLSDSPQEGDFNAQALADALDEAVRKLPPRCREVFVLAREGHLTHLQIAEVLHIAPKTVQVHMGRALALLRARLAPWLAGN